MEQAKKWRVWTDGETQDLRSWWGRIDVREIARRLHRSEDAVLVRANRLKLGGVVDPSCFTKDAAAKLLRVRTRTVGRWIAVGWLKASQAKTRHARQQRIVQIRLQDLLSFLQEYPDQWDAAQAGDVRRECNRRELLAEKIKIQRIEGIEERSIPSQLWRPFLVFVAEVAEKAGINQPKEKDWLDMKREQDAANRMPRKGMAWTEEDDRRLKELYRRGEITLRQIGVILGRSTNAVKHRLPKIDVWGMEDQRSQTA
jgi:hypothetical protein